MAPLSLPFLPSSQQPAPTVESASPRHFPSLSHPHPQVTTLPSSSVWCSFHLNHPAPSCFQFVIRLLRSIPPYPLLIPYFLCPFPYNFSPESSPYPSIIPTIPRTFFKPATSQSPKQVKALGP
ncbi:hypothetical protein BT63DRAFT_458977 [Microthyrium microscopicum]|uniref:Uncharacterized protein n=1 Tax=Microthyrium microscopicum TaxID=703497 RepID=A0A6A6TZY4_9PEZI|nr:hypothetical protein BT63DRAFT_458977 [Microthyrium microscopicum]